VSGNTYEARLLDRVAIQTRELALVVVRREYMDEGVHKLRAWCDRRSVPFEVIDENSPHRSVREAVLDFGLRKIA
jgi:hypothetical protein